MLAVVSLVAAAPLYADNPKLVADVGKNDAFVISLKDENGNSVSSIPAGTYTILVHDHSTLHNFHLSGPGVDKSTTVNGTGDTTWTVTFQVGKYSFVCDPHDTQMKGSFQVVAPTQTLAVTKAGDGAGTVTSSPTGIDCGSACSAGFTQGAAVTLTAAPATGSTFSGWGGDCTGTSTCQVAMSAAHAVSATFTLQRLGLAVVLSGNGHGSVTSAPAGIICGTACSATYAFGTAVTLTPAAADDSTFTGWGGACSGTAACTVTVDAAKSVTAGFALKRFAVHVARIGPGRVTSEPAGIACGSACSWDYDYGTKLRLSAAAGTGTTFAGWGGSCRGGGACVLDVVQPLAATAAFAPVGVVPLKTGVAVVVRVAGLTRALVELFQGKKRAASQAFALHAGRHTLRMAAPTGTYLLHLTIGSRRVVTRPVRVG